MIFERDNPVDEWTLDRLAERAADLIFGSEKIVAFTGAGVSTESGIPDFRSPGGIWDRFDPDDFTYQKFINSADARRKQWQLLWKDRLTEEVQPNPAHHAIAELHRRGKLDCVITQNVDSLHQAAGVPDDRVFELHGSMRRVICLQCGRRYPMAEIKKRLYESDEAPDCEACHGILKPDVVLFGEALPEAVFSEAAFRAEHCDLFIVVGSSLVVYPAAQLPAYAADSGARLIIINLSETPLDGQASIIIRAKAGDAMSRIVQKLAERMDS
jgi:NAD-dependent deacetylase